MSAIAKLKRDQGTSNPFPTAASSPSKEEEVKKECETLHSENVTLKNTLLHVANTSKERLQAEQIKLKEAANTFIQETEDQQKAKMARFKVAMDIQRMSDLQRQAEQAQQAMRQMLEMQKQQTEMAAKSEVEKVAEASEAHLNLVMRETERMKAEAQQAFQDKENENINLMRNAEIQLFRKTSK